MFLEGELAAYAETPVSECNVELSLEEAFGSMCPNIDDEEDRLEQVDEGLSALLLFFFLFA